MAKIDRNSYEDAKRTFKKLLPDSEIRRKVIDFLGIAISFADTINCEKWNINLDLNGHFIRFNVGHEYCIEIIESRILIICDRLSLKPKMSNQNIPVIFCGHIGRKKYESKNIDEVPDCLAKTKNSIGCVLKIADIKHNIDYFKESNLDFIKSGIRTYQLPQMRNAHSKGAIEYISRELENDLSNPIYEITNLPTLNQIIEETELQISKARKTSRQKRLEILSKSNPKPTKTIVCQTVFYRNPFVVVEVLDRAKGICENCRKVAPFKKDIDDKPYLEVHHRIPLAEGGNDTVENAIALCPNCHRHTHYGNTTY